MEVMSCPECGSLDTSEDLSTRIHTCLKCGHQSKGLMVDFLGVGKNEKTIIHSPKFQPFNIKTKIRRFNDPGLLPKN
jgi:transcription initiation factor TFIIIB Brf1 subunit/transcription initiation factor TFIIB